MLPLLLLSTLGCQEPFTEDRHDLASLRIAGVSASTDELGETTLRASVWSGAGAWHETVPELNWATGATTASGEGAVLAVEFPGSVDLDVSNGTDGESARLDLDAAAKPPLISAFTRQAVALDITQIADPIEARLAVTPTDDVPIAPGGAVRLHLDIPDAYEVHWMATTGQFAELDASTTDWFAGTAVLKDNEVESTADIEGGVFEILALVLDGSGTNNWLWLEVAVEQTDPMFYTAGRILAVPAGSEGSGFFTATVGTSDASGGVALDSLTPGADATESPELCGSAAGVPFDFGPMADGWCARSEVIGQSVVLEGEVR